MLQFHLARVGAAAVFVVVGAVLGGGPALASCRAPVSVAEFAKRADAVVYGRAISYEGGPVGRPSRALVFEVQTVLKGGARSRIVV